MQLLDFSISIFPRYELLSKYELPYRNVLFFIIVLLEYRISKRQLVNVLFSIKEYPELTIPKNDLSEKP